MTGCLEDTARLSEHVYDLGSGMHCVHCDPLAARLAGVRFRCRLAHRATRSGMDAWQPIPLQSRRAGILGSPEPGGPEAGR